MWTSPPRSFRQAALSKAACSRSDKALGRSSQASCGRRHMEREKSLHRTSARRRRKCFPARCLLSGASAAHRARPDAAITCLCRIETRGLGRRLALAHKPLVRGSHRPAAPSAPATLRGRPSKCGDNRHTKPSEASRSTHNASAGTKPHHSQTTLGPCSRKQPLERRFVPQVCGYWRKKETEITAAFNRPGSPKERRRLSTPQSHSRQTGERRKLAFGPAGATSPASTSTFVGEVEKRQKGPRSSVCTAGGLIQFATPPQSVRATTVPRLRPTRPRRLRGAQQRRNDQCSRAALYSAI